MYITEIVDVQDFTSTPGEYPLHKEYRKWHGLVMQLGGVTRTNYDGTLGSGKRGCVNFMRQGDRYDVELLEEPLKLYVINFFGDGMCEHFGIPDCEDMIPRFQEIYNVWISRKGDECGRLACMSLVYQLFSDVLLRRDKPSVPLRKRERLTPALDYIHQNFASPELRVGELTEILGVSGRYLSQLFYDVVGKSPKDYIMSLKLDYADELLDGGHSVSEVAAIAGFCDIYHFSRTYKLVRGVPPTARIKPKK